MYFEIYNSFAIKALNNTIVKNPKFSLLLVVEASTINDYKGKNFLELLQKLSNLLNINEIKDHLSLIITKAKLTDK